MSRCILPLRRKSHKREPGDKIKLHLAWPPAPPVPAVLLMASGRRYLVESVVGKTMHCMVLDPRDEVEDTPVLEWRWAPRKRKAAR